MAKMLYLSQRDVAWANTKIGKTGLRLSDWGCTLTALSMLSSFYDCYKSPKELAQIPYLFDRTGRIIWTAIPRVFGNKIKFEWRQYGRLDSAIRKSIVGSPKTSVLLEVNNKRHWVVGIATEGSRDYWIVDPIDGKKKLLSKTYPNITGSAHLTI